MKRRTAILAGLATIVAGPVLSQGSAGRLWFDPTQLPSFSGVVDRYLLTPEGKTDRLLFREGPQVLFPDHVADDIMTAVPTGRSIVVYGIRARRAPAIMLLAWSKDGDTQPHFVDRPSWTFPEYRAADERLQVSGTVRTPLYTPQGDVIGVVLDEGVVIRLPAGVAAAMGDKLAVGHSIAASGRGASVENRGKALDADRIGESPDQLEPLPAPAERPQ
jgi:hypothetical protein